MRKPPPKADLKSLAETMLKLLDDAESNVREAAMEGLGVLLRVIGERGMAGYMEGVDKSREEKIREYAAKAEVRVAGAAPPVKKVDMKPEPSIPIVNRAGGQIGSGKVTLGAGKSKPNSAPSNSATSNTSSAKPASSSSSSSSLNAIPAKKKAVDEPVSFKFSDDSAELWMAEAFPDVDLKAFGDSNWKTRLAACQAFLESLQQAAVTIEGEAVVRFFGKTPGWKESNFQVGTSMVSCFDFCVKKGVASKGASSLVLIALAEKLGDVKLKKTVGDHFTTIAEKYSLQFVLSTLYEPLSKAKSPKTVADSLLWIHSMIMEFGIVGLDVKALIEFVKTALGNTNASVRANAITVMGGLRIWVGPDVRMFVADLGTQQLASIDAEFEKVASRAPPAPARVTEDAGAGGTEDLADNLFPRVDLTTKVTPETFE
ncbi:Cytoskeleton associated protein 5, partial [Physocladia obscura]